MKDLVRFEKTFILVAFLLLFIPITPLGNVVAYSIPFFLFLFFIFFRYRISQKYLILIIVFLLFNAASSIVSGNGVINFLLALVTFFPLVFLIIGRKEFKASMLKVWYWGFMLFGLYLSCIVIFQLVRIGFEIGAFRNPDYFGLPYGRHIGAHIIPIVLFLLALLNLGIFASTKKQKYLFLSLFLVIVGIISEFNAANLSLMLAFIFLAIMLITKMLKKTLLANKIDYNYFKLFLFIIILPALIFVSLNIFGGYSYFENSVRTGFNEMSRQAGQAINGKNIKSLKIKTHIYSLTTLPLERPYQPLFGLGLGSYSSRAGLILSGRYLGSHPWWVPVSYNTFSYGRIYSYWGVPGTINQPQSSWLTLWSETGVIGIALFLYLFFKKLKTAREVANKNKDLFVKGVVQGLHFCIPFFILILFFDNILEFPWITFPLFLGFTLLPLKVRG